MSLIKNIVRRIEWILNSNRPEVPPIGTNHVDDASSWNENMIYQGELAIQMEDGKLYTQDGKQPIEIGAKDGIVSGMIVSTSGVSLREINVSAGYFQIDGRMYRHDGAIDIDDSTILIEENIENYPRLDAVCVKGDLNFQVGDFYGGEFKVFKGEVASDISLPTITDDYILLGLVLVIPNQTVQDVLRPLTVFRMSDTQRPLKISPEFFVRDLTARILRWEVNTLYFKDQTVEFDNNLYKVAYTHVSSESLTTDFANGKLISLGAVTNSNVSRFSHVGSNPTEGNWVDYFFNKWNSDTRILDAFQDISKFIFGFAPQQPVNIDESELQLLVEHNKAGFANLAYSDLSNFTENCIDSTLIVSADTVDKFVPFDSGSLRGTLTLPATSYSTALFDLSSVPSVLPNSQIISDTGDNFTLTVVRDDHYGTLQGYKGFYNSVYARFDTLNILVADYLAYKFTLTHLSSGDFTELPFYLESVRPPVISNVSNFLARATSGVKYLSGQPILTSGDQIEFDYDIDDAVRYFYNHEKISEVNSEIMDNVQTLSFADTTYFDPSTIPPFVDMVNPASDGPTVGIRQVVCVVGTNVIESSPNFSISAYNAIGESVEYATGGTGFLVDTVSEEIGSRIYAGTGSDYPVGSYGVDWGYIYDLAQSQESLFLTGNRELQYFGGRYFYPQTDYSQFTGVWDGGNFIPYKDYSNNDTTTYRWTMFDLGDLDAQKYLHLEIKNSNGITYVLNDGITVTPNFKMYVKIHNEITPSLGTGWVDLNKAYNSTLITNPVNNGDPALDLGWMEGNPKFRRATFGTIERTGKILVRIGTVDKAISFKDVVLTNETPELNDGLWDEFNLGWIIGESYVVLSIDGTDNSLMTDFLNGTTMTSDFDIQVRILNTENTALGTDWIDANESYPANGFIPVDYEDPALDLTYYDSGAEDATIRKVTFGPTTRTGQLQVRIKINGNQHYTGVSVVYPEYI